VKRLALAVTLFGIAALAAAAAFEAPPPSAGRTGRHTFALGTDEFLLDGKPFQIRGCEIHPARVPVEYWAHRIRMSKALGCNTIAAYLFWNYHETSEGTFDFTSGNRDIARFIALAQAEGLWVLLRPGPYVCAEWDFGGLPTYLLRDLIASSLPPGEGLPPVPESIAAVAVPEFPMRAHASIWTHLSAPVRSVQPRTFEAYGQNQGLVLYRTTLVGRKSGKLVITDLHDYALVFLDGGLVATLDRRLGEQSIDLPASTSRMPVLDILVEGMGHINFAQAMIDRKGITDRVTLAGMTLMNWDAFLLPLDAPWVASLREGPVDPGRPGIFFRGTFTLDWPADTYLDMTGYRKGVVWINGHNLGRFWDVGPQRRLYCPAPWLKAGANEVVVFDLHQTSPAPLRGTASQE